MQLSNISSAISNQIFCCKLFLRIQITLGTVHSLRYLCISIKGLATKEQYILKVISRPFTEKLPPFFDRKLRSFVLYGSMSDFEFQHIPRFLILDNVLQHLSCSSFKTLKLNFLKVRKSQRYSNPPKNQQFFFLASALASKEWSNQKNISNL